MQEYEFASHRFLLGYDYTPYIASDTKAVIGAFAGYSLGLLKVKNNLIKDIAPAVSNTLDGFTYGAKLGVIYEANDKWNIEFGAKIMQTRYKSKDLEFSFNRNGKSYHIQNQPLELKQFETGIYLGASYKFLI